MFGPYARTLYRSLSRHRLYTALNVGGLAVGIAVFLILLLTVRYEMGFDRWIPHVDQVYRLNADVHFPGTSKRFSSNIQGVVTPLLKQDYPQIKAITRVREGRAIVKIDGRPVRQPITGVDPDFFKVFELPLVAGDAATALRDPASVVLSEKVAATLFPDGDAFGRSIDLTIGGKTRAYRVTAILRDTPDESTLDLPALVPINRADLSEEEAVNIFDTWGSFSMSAYMRIASPDDAATIGASLGDFVKRRIPPDALPSPIDEVIRYSVMPLTDVHFADARDPNAEKSADPADVAILGLVGLMTLVIAAINYVNLATARAGLRAREVAVRKALGATRRALTLQFMTEAVLLAAAAGLFGLALTELVLPVVNAYGGTHLKLAYFGFDGVLVMVAIAVLAVGLGAGAWPAMALSSFAPAGVLASARSPGGGKAGSRLRSALVLLQFTVALVFSICTAVMLDQSHHLRTADLGFSREGLLIVDRLGVAELENRRLTLMDQYRRLPGVVSATISSRSPATGSVASTNVSRPGHVGEEPSVVIEVIGPGYFETYGVHLAAGRAFDPTNRLDDTAAGPGDSPESGAVGHNVMLSESALPVLGFPSAVAAVGQTVRFGGDPMTVIGVIRDVRFRSPRDQIPAVLYRYRSDEIPGGVAAIRYRGDPAAVRNAMETTWRGFAPTVPFEAKTVAQMLEPYYEPEDQRSRLFGLGAGVAILIGALGLYGMAAFVTARRTREIGIRKTLGASTTEVLGLLVSEFLRPVGVAAIIACPVAFLLMSRWLERFDDRVGLSPVAFILPVAGAVLIAVLTVLGHAMMTARSEPAKALRSL
jgi:putative ABC transport system permease protein